MCHPLNRVLAVQYCVLVVEYSVSPGLFGDKQQEQREQEESCVLRVRIDHDLF